MTPPPARPRARPRLPGRRRDAGFTLLEVLVALAILGIAVVATIQGFAQGLRLLKLSGDHQAAILLADQKTREVLRPAEGHEEGTEDVFVWRRTTTLVEAPELQPPGTSAQWRVYRIAVTVRWDERRQVELATLRTASVQAERAQAARPPASGAPR